MTEEQYLKIKRFVRSRLSSHLINNYLEDCTQYVAMIACRNPRANWNNLVIDYLRHAGVSYGKKGRTKDASYHVDDRYNVEEVNKENPKEKSNDHLNSFLKKLNLDEETIEWVKTWKKEKK